MAFLPIIALRSHDERSNRSAVTIGFAFSHGLGREQTLADVLACVRVSKTTLYRWSRDGLFPRPRALTPTGSTVAWLASKVYEWIESKQAANDGTFVGTSESEALKAA